MIEELIVRFSPALIRPGETEGRVAVMADILRASTTIIRALAQGAEAVYPCAEIDASKQLAKQLGASSVLGGERKGKIVEGFDRGNSPLEYSAENIEGRPLVLCTTNGTHTLEFCRQADRVFIGGLVNLTAVCDRLMQFPRGMIACAGTGGLVTDEDVLFAGAVANNLLAQNANLILDDAAQLALTRWRTVIASVTAEQPLWTTLAQSHGGRNLMRLGYEDDIRYCSQVDAHANLPELDLSKWVIGPGNRRISSLNSAPTSHKTP